MPSTINGNKLLISYNFIYFEVCRVLVGVSFWLFGCILFHKLIFPEIDIAAKRRKKRKS